MRTIGFQILLSFLLPSLLPVLPVFAAPPAPELVPNAAFDQKGLHWKRHTNFVRGDVIQDWSLEFESGSAVIDGRDCQPQSRVGFRSDCLLLDTGRGPMGGPGRLDDAAGRETGAAAGRGRPAVFRLDLAWSGRGLHRAGAYFILESKGSGPQRLGEIHGPGGDFDRTETVYFQVAAASDAAAGSCVYLYVFHDGAGRLEVDRVSLRRVAMDGGEGRDGDGVRDGEARLILGPAPDRRAQATNTTLVVESPTESAARLDFTSDLPSDAPLLPGEARWVARAALPSAPDGLSAADPAMAVRRWSVAQRDVAWFWDYGVGRRVPFWLRPMEGGESTGWDLAEVSGERVSPTDAGSSEKERFSSPVRSASPSGLAISPGARMDGMDGMDSMDEMDRTGTAGFASGGVAALPGPSPTESAAASSLSLLSSLPPLPPLPANRAVYLYYYGRFRYGGREADLERDRAEMVWLCGQGVTGLLIQDNYGLDYARRLAGKKPDGSFLLAIARAYREAGFPSPLVFGLFSGLDKGRVKWTGGDDRADAWLAGIAPLVREAEAILGPGRLRIAPVDEPNDVDRRNAAQALLPRWKKALGLETVITVNWLSSAQLPGADHLWVGAGDYPSFEALGTRGNISGFYCGLDGNSPPLRFRWLAGIHAWATGLSSQAYWHFCDVHGSPASDLDDRQEDLLCVHPDSPVSSPTLALPFAALREGWMDLRLLCALDSVRHSISVKNAADIDGFLNRVRASAPATDRLSAPWDRGEAFRRFRAEAVRLWIAAAGGAGPGGGRQDDKGLSGMH